MSEINCFNLKLFKMILFFIIKNGMLGMHGAEYLKYYHMMTPGFKRLTMIVKMMLMIVAMLMFLSAQVRGLRLCNK